MISGPHILVSLLALLFGIVSIAAYLGYKIHSKRQGKAPSVTSVFYKILVSTFQVLNRKDKPFQSYILTCL